MTKPSNRPGVREQLLRCIETLKPYTGHLVGSEGSFARMEQMDRALAYTEAKNLVAALTSPEKPRGEPEAVTLLQQFIDAYDKGAVELSSEQIGDPSVDILPHPWHEEWLHYVRALLASGSREGSETTSSEQAGQS